MELLRKQNIEVAFLDAMLKVCIANHVPLCQTTVLVKFSKTSELKLNLCRNDKAHLEMDISDLFNRKMVGIGLTKESLLKLFHCVHYAFIQEKNLEKDRISLLIYFSKIAGCVCVGILEDTKPYRTLKIADLFEAMNIGTEQNN